MNKFMELAKNASLDGIKNNEGGPFGAVIIDSSGNVVATGYNRVLSSCDPTAHAEVEVIRSACKFLNTYDLAGCTLFTSCEPCPMCLSAAIWANIKTIYYGCNRKDAEKIGFRDDIIYNYLEGKNKNLVNLIPLDRDNCLEAFEAYNKKNGVIY